MPTTTAKSTKNNTDTLRMTFMELMNVIPIKVALILWGFKVKTLPFKVNPTSWVCSSSA